MYKVKLSESSLKFYQNCEKNLAKKLNRCFEILKINPYASNNIKKLSGVLKNYFRYRLGDYRIVFKVDHLSKEIVVRNIEHRSKVYKML